MTAYSHSFISVRRSLFALATVLLLALAACGGNPQPPVPTPTPTPGAAIDEPLAAVATEPPEPYPPASSTKTPLSYPIATPTPYEVTFEAATPTTTASAPLEPSSTPSASSAIYIEELTQEQIDAMSIRREIEDDSTFPMFQVSQTPLGVQEVHWSATGSHLLLEVATSDNNWMGPVTTPIIMNLDSDVTWGTGTRGNSLCLHMYEWSPQRTEIAFARDGQLYVAGADGNIQNAFSFLPDKRLVTSPYYSPDGTMIAAQAVRVVEERGVVTDVWVYDATGGEPSLLIEDAGNGGLAWSPQSDAVAHLGEGNSSEQFSAGAATLRIAPLDGTSPTSVQLDSLPGIEGCLGAPEWTAQGQQIVSAVHGRPGVWLVDRQGNAQLLDVSQSGAGEASLGSSNWGSAIVSPDGRYVLFEHGATLSAPHVIDLQTNEVRPISVGDMLRVAWSPTDPYFLAWSRAERFPLKWTDAIDGSSTTIDERGNWPSWSPGGQRIAYWKIEGETMNLWLWSLQGDSMQLASFPSVDLDLTYLSEGGRFRIAPRWSPDGSALAFIAPLQPDSHPEAFVIELE